MLFLFQKYDVTAIILAGGKSSRMGFNKEELIIHNEKLIDKQIRLLKPLFKEIIIISKNKELYIEKDILVFEDILESMGPLSGLHSGLTHSKTMYNYVIACDMPYIDQAFIINQINNLDDKEAYIVKTPDNVQPFHGFYKKSITEKIENYIQKKKSFIGFIESLDAEYKEYYSKIFTNLNSYSDVEEINKENETYKSFSITKTISDDTFYIPDNIVTEFPITLYVNSEKYVTLLITPTKIEDLIIGYLKNEKLIDRYSDISSINLHLDENRIDVVISKPLNLEDLNKDKLLASGCGVGTRFHNDLDTLITTQSEFTITEKELFEASKKLNNSSGLFNLTGGVHSALLITNEEQKYTEDIGRHNAVDKAIGYFVRKEIPLDNSYIFVSGRVSSDMLVKCAVNALPIVISRSAPTSLSVELADKYGITLIGFVRGNRYNVYTHSFRIKR